MKRIILLLALFAFVAGCPEGVRAEESITGAKDLVKYEVSFSVTYNAVTVAEAAKIAAEVMEKHKDACQVRVNTKRVGDDGDPIRFRYSDGTSTWSSD